MFHAPPRFSPASRRRRIDDHIATSLRVEPDDFADELFFRISGYGKAVELLGDGLATILDELNARLAA